MSARTWPDTPRLALVHVRLHIEAHLHTCAHRSVWQRELAREQREGVSTLRPPHSERRLPKQPEVAKIITDFRACPATCLAGSLGADTGHNGHLRHLSTWSKGLATPINTSPQGSMHVTGISRRDLGERTDGKEVRLE